MIADDFDSIKRALDEIKKQESSSSAKEPVSDPTPPINTVYGIWVKSHTVNPQPDTAPAPPATTWEDLYRQYANQAICSC